jgi:hypothetical protein
LEYCGFVFDLSGPPPDGSYWDDGVIRLADAQDVPRLDRITCGPEYEGSAMDAEAIGGRLRAGDVCVLAEAAGEIVAVSWIRFDNATYSKKWLSMPLESGEAYCAWTHTVPGHRGSGIASQIALWRLRWLQEQGVRVAYSWITPANLPMLRVVERAGAIPVTRLNQYYPRVLHRPRLNVVHVAPAPPRLSDWCSPARMRFPRGLALFTRATRQAVRPTVQAPRLRPVDSA